MVIAGPHDSLCVVRPGGLCAVIPGDVCAVRPGDVCDVRHGLVAHLLFALHMSLRCVAVSSGYGGCDCEGEREGGEEEGRER